VHPSLALLTAVPARVGGDGLMLWTAVSLTGALLAWVLTLAVTVGGDPS